MPNPNTAVYPGAIVTDASLTSATNSFSTILTSNIGTGDTTFNLSSTTFNLPCVLRIDNELILITAISGLGVTACTRAFDGTVAASHSSGATAKAFIIAHHHNQLAAEIKAMQTLLGVDGGNVKPVGVVFRAAAAISGVPVLGFSVPVSGGPSGVVYAGTNTLLALAAFSTSNSVQDHFTLPSTYTGTITADLLWRATAITGVVNWKLSLTKINVGSTIDPSFNTATSLLASPAGTTNQFVHSQITGVSTTGLQADREMLFKLERNATSDTLTGTAELLSIRFTIS